MPDQDLIPGESTQAVELAGVEQQKIKNFTFAVYILYILGLFIGITGLIGLIVAYVKRNDARGTVYYDHFCFLIKTFWISFIFGVIGFLLAIVVIGYFILTLVWFWYVFRVVAGFIRMLDNKPVSPSGWWL